MNMIFETHAHYNDEAFQNDRDEIFAQFPGKRIGRAVNIASDLESIDECIALADRYPFMYCALGIHPSDSAPLTDELLAGIREKLKHPRVVAVGEIGLDYYWDTPDRSIQKHWFEEQLEMAREADLPLVIHSREAAQDTMQIMQKHRAQEIGGVIHCYSYSLELLILRRSPSAARETALSICLILPRRLHRSRGLKQKKSLRGRRRTRSGSTESADGRCCEQPMEEAYLLHINKIVLKSKR